MAKKQPPADAKGVLRPDEEQLLMSIYVASNSISYHPVYKPPPLTLTDLIRVYTPLVRSTRNTLRAEELIRRASAHCVDVADELFRLEMIFGSLPRLPIFPGPHTRAVRPAAAVDLVRRIPLAATIGDCDANEKSINEERRHAWGAHVTAMSTLDAEARSLGLKAHRFALSMMADAMHDAWAPLVYSVRSDLRSVPEFVGATAAVAAFTDWEALRERELIQRRLTPPTHTAPDLVLPSWHHACDTAFQRAAWDLVDQMAQHRRSVLTAAAASAAAAAAAGASPGSSSSSETWAELLREFTTLGSDPIMRDLAKYVRERWVVTRTIDAYEPTSCARVRRALEDWNAFFQTRLPALRDVFWAQTTRFEQDMRAVVSQVPSMDPKITARMINAFKAAASIHRSHHKLVSPHAATATATAAATATASRAEDSASLVPTWSTILGMSYQPNSLLASSLSPADALLWLAYLTARRVRS